MENKLCPANGKCGGCLYQGTPYEDQLNQKEKEVHRLFEKAGIEPDHFDPIEGCAEDHFHYRNKMEYTFGDMEKDGPLELGMHMRRRFMSVVTVDECQLVSEDFNRILRATLAFVKAHSYVKYHKKLHTGLLRNLIVRRGVRTHELLVNIVTSTDGEFDDEAWVNTLLDLPLDDTIVGIMHTYDDQLADAVKVDSVKTLYGRDYYMEEIAGLKFRVQEFAFFQTNVDAAERMYEQAVSLIDGLEGKTVFDLYCGTGTISQIMARKAKDVYGVEIVPESVEAAEANAELNGLDNCRFICDDVFKALSATEKTPDVIVCDPPRVGIMKDAVEKIASYGVPQIVYVSCNPKTLVQNLQQFSELGYHTVYAKPYDNFPLTKHVETVVLMSRKDT